MFLVRAIYYSTAALPVTPKGFDQGIEAILDASQRNNPREGLTGVLAYDDRHFIQVLEGSREAVSRRLLAIFADLRHSDVTLVEFAELSRRRFGDWTMAFVDRDDSLRIRSGPNWLSYAPSETILAFLERAVSTPDAVRTAE